jgi:hypothetical protein
MSTLDELALLHGTDKASSHHGYCAIYERYLQPLRTSPVRLLEIGTQFNFSVRMWLDYFRHGGAEIIGVDLMDNAAANPQYRVEDPRFTFLQGDQTNLYFWKNATGLIGEIIHVIIDDGSHRAADQEVSFNALWKCLKPGGLYCLEDVFTWWHPHFASGTNGTFWLKDMISELNGHGIDFFGNPTPPEILPPKNELEKTIDFIHCYRGLVIIGKKR